MYLAVAVVFIHLFAIELMLFIVKRITFVSKNMCCLPLVPVSARCTHLTVIIQIQLALLHCRILLE